MIATTTSTISATSSSAPRSIKSHPKPIIPSILGLLRCSRVFRLPADGYWNAGRSLIEPGMTCQPEISGPASREIAVAQLRASPFGRQESRRLYGAAVAASGSAARLSDASGAPSTAGIP